MSGVVLNVPIRFRVTGQGALRVLLLHALTGGPDAADRPGLKGWWASLFREGAPLAGDRARVWTPNLPGSCYGSGPLETPSIRAQAEALAAWIEAEDLRFEALIGASLGGMVAQELALCLPGRFRILGVVGCGARADAWLWGTNEVQRAILDSPNLGDGEAIALARRAAMLSFRTPVGLGARFTDPGALRDWLRFHGEALAARFTRKAYRDLLEAMDSHDLGRGRGGLVPALGGLGIPLRVLGLDPDFLFPRTVVEELHERALEAGLDSRLDWITGPHGHDAFLIEEAASSAWVDSLLKEVAA